MKLMAYLRHRMTHLKLGHSFGFWVTLNWADRLGFVLDPEESDPGIGFMMGARSSEEPSACERASSSLGAGPVWEWAPCAWQILVTVSRPIIIMINLNSVVDAIVSKNQNYLIRRLYNIIYVNLDKMNSCFIISNFNRGVKKSLFAESIGVLFIKSTRMPTLFKE